VLPIGWITASAVAIGAVFVRALVVRRYRSVFVVLAGVLCVASVRAAGSIWLPHVCHGPTRQHVTSIWVGVAATVGPVVVAVSTRDRSPRLTTGPDRSPLTHSNIAMK
jgi:hypothetical protein